MPPCRIEGFVAVNLEKKLSERVRNLRLKHGYTQLELAERAGLEYKYIQMLEGKQPPSPTLRTLSKLARAFRLEPWQLIRLK
jgi:transcriptional regulator with XRE-family HTH domain